MKPSGPTLAMCRFLILVIVVLVIIIGGVYHLSLVMVMLKVKFIDNDNNGINGDNLYWIDTRTISRSSSFPGPAIYCTPLLYHQYGFVQKVLNF